MNEELFRKFYLEDIRSVLSEVMNSAYSSFYKEKYKNLDFDVTKVSSYEDFRKIPLLTKDEILSVPLEDRCFISSDRIDRFAISSGTTNRRNLLILPRGATTVSSGDGEYFPNWVDLKGKQILILTSPASPGFISSLNRFKRLGAITVVGDFSNLERTAIMLEQMDIFGIRTSITGLSSLFEILKSKDYDFHSIKYIHLSSESISKTKLDFYKKAFPSATFFFEYGAAESGLRGFQCKHLHRKSHNIFHPNKCLIEKASPSSRESELIYTSTLSGLAFPLVRYSTGDFGDTFESICECGRNYSFNLMGRQGGDKLSFSGLVLYSELIDAALADYIPLLEDYRVIVSEELTDKGPKNKLTLEFASKEVLTKAKQQDMLLNFTQKLQLSAKKTLAQLVEDEVLLAPSLCEMKPRKSGKKLRIRSTI